MEVAEEGFRARMAGELQREAQQQTTRSVQYVYDDMARWCAKPGCPRGNVPAWKRCCSDITGRCKHDTAADGVIL